VQQALAFGDLAPGRLRLGIGPSHRPTNEGVYGSPITAPLENLRENEAELRSALLEGNVDHHGRFFTIKATLPRTPRTPILISALRQGAFQLAGEIADGAISWMCPVQYLLEKALPALLLGAANSERPVPPLLAHIPVALGQDRHEVMASSRKQINRYARLPFYANMFAEADFPFEPDGSMSDNLIESLVVSGDEATITSRLTDLLASGLDELIVMPIPVVDPAV
jgi:alkanesulfonate monooxygenase SsuD/methylene tetrahydromethanopterin reductase-like flavin-dependent oxidoreductase (luciferase family)